MYEPLFLALWGFLFDLAVKAALVWCVVVVFKLRKRVDALERELRPTAVRDVVRARTYGGRAGNVPWDIGS